MDGGGAFTNMYVHIVQFLIFVALNKIAAAPVLMRDARTGCLVTGNAWAKWCHKRSVGHAVWISEDVCKL